MDDVRIPVEELLEFPSTFAFKAVGHHTVEFPRRCLRSLQNALGDDRPIQLRTRLSAKAAYISVTLTATVRSADELRAGYAALRDVVGCITAL